MQVEAEDLRLDTYLIEDNEFASGKKLISLLHSGGMSGLASGEFRGYDGNYYVVVNGC